MPDIPRSFEKRIFDLEVKVDTLEAKLDITVEANQQLLQGLEELSAAFAEANEADDDKGQPPPDPMARSPIGTPGREPQVCEICNGRGVVTKGDIVQPCDCVDR